MRDVPATSGHQTSSLPYAHCAIQKSTFRVAIKTRVYVLLRRRRRRRRRRKQAPMWNQQNVRVHVRLLSLDCMHHAACRQHAKSQPQARTSIVLWGRPLSSPEADRPTDSPDATVGVQTSAGRFRPPRAHRRRTAVGGRSDRQGTVSWTTHNSSMLNGEIVTCSVGDSRHLLVSIKNPHVYMSDISRLVADVRQRRRAAGDGRSRIDLRPPTLFSWCYVWSAASSLGIFASEPN
jgi:hypothetical protein